MGLFSRMKQRGGRAAKAPIRATARWMDLEQHQETFENLRSRLHQLATPARPTRHESFEQAVERFNLSDNEIEEIQSRYFMIAITFVIIALMIFGYAIFHFVHVHTGSGFIALGLTFFSFGMAFRYHFWYTQIKYRRLGFTFGEWLMALWSGKQS